MTVHAGLWAVGLWFGVLTFAGIVGKRSFDVTAESIVVVVPAINVNQNVPATANPFLAGMPKGSVASLHNPHNSPDYAGDASNWKQSPIVVPGLPLVEGQTLTFDSISGTARHDLCVKTHFLPV